MGTGRLDRLGLGSLAIAKKRLSAAVALPDRGDVRLEGKGQRRDVTLLAVVRGPLAWCELRVRVVLVTRGAQSRSTEPGLAHRYRLSVGTCGALGFPGCPDNVVDGPDVPRMRGGQTRANGVSVGRVSLG